MQNHSRIRWGYINRDKDIEKQSDIKPYERANSKHKTKPKGTKTRDKVDPDTKDVAKDKDLKRQ
jgi:hypothetical protein